MTENEMTTYYAKRASEYELIYQKPERQEDLRQLQSVISGCFADRDVLEIACGTGYWTQFACRSAKSIVATDCNEEVLNIARKKDYGNTPVNFVKADAYALDNLEGVFSAALVGFWWSHVPKSRIKSFLRVLHSKLFEDSIVIMLDNLYVEGSSTPISRTDDHGNTYQDRKLSNGTTHEVLKNFPARDDFAQWFGPVSGEYEFEKLSYFWLGKYTIKGNAEQVGAPEPLTRPGDL